METRRIGGLWDGETKHQAGSIWDSLGLSPTIDTMTGGGREPHIMEILKVEDIKQLGKLEEGSSQRRIVYDTEYASPTLQAAMGAGGGNVPLVVESEKGLSVKELGFIDKGTGKHQSNTVYDKDELAPCVCAVFGDKQRERTDKPDNNDGEYP